MNSKHFQFKEFGCRCCGESKVARELLVLLELVRLKFGKAVIITSGYRCKNHNDNVGSNDRSQHRLGTACDIVIKGVSPKVVYEYLNTTFPDHYGFGLYVKSGFVHIDVREGKKGRW